MAGISVPGMAVASLEERLMTEEESGHYGELQIRHDPLYQRRLWTFQRLGWVGLVLAMAAALLGLFGSGGPLDESVATAEAMRVEYDRFPHNDTRTVLRITVAASRTPADPFELWIDADYLKDVEVESPTPEALSAHATGEALVLRFAAGDEGEALLVSLPVRPTKLGRLRARLRAGRTAQPVEFTQFVYP